MDLGACWLGVHPREDRIKNISSFFNLPKNIIPIAVIAIGHPKTQHQYRTRFSSEKIHFEHWQKNI
jgi:nitroreductase